MVKKTNKQEEYASPEDDLAAELLLKDADDALRQEELRALWNEWGSTIIGMALMVVFGTMIGVGWQNWRTSVTQGQTTQLIKSQDSLSLSFDGLNDYYGGIAKMIKAGTLLSSDDRDAIGVAKAHDLLVDVSEAGLPTEWSILSQWGQLRTAADLKNEDDIPAITDDMIALANKGNNPYAAVILTEAAVIKGESGDKVSALDLLKQASALSNNASLTSHIQSIINLYTIEAAS